MLVNRGGADLATRLNDLDDGLADVITVGTMSLANPDLVERLKTGAPLNTPDPDTFYGGNEVGYLDYPTLTPAPTSAARRQDRGFGKALRLLKGLKGR